MNISQTHLHLKGLRFYAYHGVLPQESLVGAAYTVDLTLTTDFKSACFTDQLNDTVSYAEIYEVVKTEMQQPSQLLEHVAGRIATAIFRAFPSMETVRVALYKQNPPMGADADQIGVEIVCHRD